VGAIQDALWRAIIQAGLLRSRSTGVRQCLRYRMGLCAKLIAVTVTLVTAVVTYITD
jgi:hypothetical protein